MDRERGAPSGSLAAGPLHRSDKTGLGGAKDPGRGGGRAHRATLLSCGRIPVLVVA